MPPHAVVIVGRARPETRRRPNCRNIATAVVLAATFVASQGCGTRRDPRGPITRFDRLSLQRTCFCPRPQYTVSLTADRRIIFLGGRNATTPWAAGVASSAQMEKLVAALNRAGFLNLRDRYQRTEDGCEGVSFDAPKIFVSMTLGELTKSVKHDHGCVQHGVMPAPKVSMPPAPPWPYGPGRPPDRGCPYPLALTALEEEIDTILGTEVWIGRAWPPDPNCPVRNGGK